MALRPFTAGPSLGTNAHSSDPQPEGASQTFKKGALLIPSSGNLVEAGADPTTVVGIADEDGHNATVATKLARYMPADSQHVFEGTLMGAAAASVALAAIDRFTRYGVAKDSATGFWYIDQSETSAILVIITGFRDPIGTLDARVYFRFLNSKSLFA